MAKKKAKPTTKSPTATPQALKDEHYAAIREAGREVEVAHAQYLEAKAESSELRKRWEKQSAAMIRLIRQGPNDQLGLPFGSVDWRFRSLDVLGLSDGIVGKLAENDVNTLGDLSDYWAEGKLLSDVKGFGGEKSATVVDAWADYGKDHPEIFEREDDGNDPDDDPDEDA